MKNLTPQHLRCEWGGCPSVHELEDGRLLIVGEMQFDWWAREKGGNPGQNEMGVIIDRALLSTIRDEVRQECANVADEARAKCLDYDEIAAAIRALKETPHE
jgi:hypothetical protein